MTYRVGDNVIVRKAFPPGHVRAPFFIRGKAGVIDQIAGEYKNPEELAYGRRDAAPLSLYRVRFMQSHIWADYDGPEQDSIVIDIYENWLDNLEATS